MEERELLPPVTKVVFLPKYFAKTLTAFKMEKVVP